MRPILLTLLFFSLSGILSDLQAQEPDSLQFFLDSVQSNDSIALQNAFFNSTKNLDQSSLAKTYLIWGTYLEKNQNYDSAEALFLKSLSLFDSLLDKSDLAAAKMNLADFYRNDDNIPKSLKLCHEAYDIYVDLKDSMNIYYSLSRIGINHDYLGDHDIAIKYYNECVKICKEIGYDLGEARMYHNLGGIYGDEQDFDLALDYYEKSKKTYESYENYYGLHVVYQGLYLTYKNMELYAEAYTNLKKEYRYALLAESSLGKAFSYQDHGSYFLSTGNYDSSIYYSKKALQLAKKLNKAQIETNAYEGLRKAYYESGDYKNAYDFYQREKAMNDSLYNLQNSQLVTSIKTKFETEKKERALAEKNLELQTADFNLKKQQTYQAILILVLLLISTSMFFVYRGYKLRKKANDLLRQKNAEIESQNEQIKSVNEMKSRWFINVAHELRTPLTLIKGPIQKILNTEPLSLDVEEDLNMVHKNTQNLVKLVNEILDLSKLEDGEMTLNKSVVNFNELVRQIISLYDSKVALQNVAITWEEMTDPYLELDPDKISKILVNLISNALRFSESGGEVSVYSQVDSDLKIIVRDTGAGIQKDDLDRVFDRFYQAESHKNAGGTGVGLALSKEIAELHNGKLSVTSKPDEETLFTLSLPKDIIQSKPEHISEAVEAESALEDNFISTNILSRLSEKPELLIVEDNADMRKYISGLLKPYFEIKEAAHGIEGLEQLKNNNIRVIISDMMMPEMDGLLFSKKVKASKEWKNIPFIHLSALSEDFKRKEALRVGVDDYLQKPFDPEELIIRIQNLFQNAVSRMEVVPEQDEEVSYDDKILKKLRDEIMSNISDSNFSVLRLADCAAMSERQIYRYLKNATGLTPLQFIQEIKLSRAMELVQKRVFMNSSELASAVGFQHSPYFSSIFEKRFGKKPSAYLKVG